MDPEDPLPEDADAEAQSTAGDDPWHEEGWYFDLPDGAWERQEAKNRALRENIRVNAQRAAAIRALESRRDPFISRDPLSALAQHEDGPGWGDEMDDTPVSQQPNDEWRGDGIYGGGMEGSHGTDSGRHVQSEWQATEQEPEEEWGEPGGHMERRTGPRRPGGISVQHGAGPAERSAGRGPIPLRPRDIHHATPEGAESPADGDEPRPRSRWDEMFGGPADTSIVEAMRDWTTHAREEEHRQRDLGQLPPELLQPFDWEEAEPGAAVAGDWQQEEEPATAGARAGSSGWGPQASGGEERPHASGERLPAMADLFDDQAPPQAAPDGHRGIQASPDRKPGVFSRLLGRGHAGEDGVEDEWKLDMRAFSEDATLPAAAGSASETPTAWASADAQPGRDPETFPAHASGDGFEATLEDDEDDEEDEEGPASRGPRTGAWGAPPSSDDGSLKYDLPRRITGKGVWEDDWFESPGGSAVAAAASRGGAALSPAASGHEATGATEAHRMDAGIRPPGEPADRTGLPAVAAAEAPTAKLEEKAKGEDADGGVETGDAEGEAWEAPVCVQETAAGESSPDAGGPMRDTAAPGRADAPGQQMEDDPWAVFMASRQADGPDAFGFASDRDARLAS